MGWGKTTLDILLKKIRKETTQNEVHLQVWLNISPN